MRRRAFRVSRSLGILKATTIRETAAGKRHARCVDRPRGSGCRSAYTRPRGSDLKHGNDTTAPVLARGETDTGRCWDYVCDDRPFGGPAPAAALFHYARDQRAVQRIARRSLAQVEELSLLLLDGPPAPEQLALALNARRASPQLPTRHPKQLGWAAQGKHLPRPEGERACNGVAYRTRRRLETEGQASLEDMVKAAVALRCEDALSALFPLPAASSLDALLAQQAASAGIRPARVRAPRSRSSKAPHP